MTDDLGGAQPKRVNLQELMAGRYFVIPDYQRYYAWTEKECEELFADIVATARNPTRHRFMSTITVINPSGDSKYQTYQEGYQQLTPSIVVDGQQRLTSITILIAAICRSLFEQNGSESGAAEAHTRYVLARVQTGEHLLRLVPQNLPDHHGLMRNFFSNIVAMSPLKDAGKKADIIPAQDRLRKAKLLFEEGLRKLDETITPADILMCITSRLSFILNTLSNVGEAGEVFEGINNRGLGLSILENIKAYAVYAVQSFRNHETLPQGVTGASTASNLIDEFNGAIGKVYLHLDRVDLKDDDARDLLVATWPVIVTRIRTADLASEKKPVVDSLDKTKPAQQLRDSLQISTAQARNQPSVLLNTLHQVLCNNIVNASRFFADARRPEKNVSFQGLDLNDTDQKELRALHQRLVEMEVTNIFLPLFISFRTMRPDDGNGYLLLARAAERVAFWVYVQGGSNAGKGQKHLALLARRFADAEILPDDVFKGLYFFALSNGDTVTSFETDNQHLLDDEIELKELLDGTFFSSRAQISKERIATVAYEWLRFKGIKLPTYRQFVQRHSGGQSLQLVPIPPKGKHLPNGFDNELRTRMNLNPGNIVITDKLPAKVTKESQTQFDKYEYRQKVKELSKIGFKLSFPKTELDRKWADDLENKILDFSVGRWRFPADGKINQPTWVIPLPDDAGEGDNNEDRTTY